MKVQHILIATDLSEEAVRPMKAMAELARSQGARITVLNVVEDVPAFPRGAALAPPVSSPDLEQRLADARKAVEAEHDDFAGVPATFDVIPGGDVAQAIASYASEKNVDLIAISTHGRTGFRHLVLGSVAESLLRHSTVPVIVFPRSDT